MLNVDGTLHLYTTLLGWQLYEVVWNLLKSTGLVWLPILGVLIDHIAEVRSRGSFLKNNAESAFAGLELQFVFMLIVVAIGAVPSITLDPANIQYRDQVDVYNTSEEIRTFGSTDSRADGTPQTAVNTVNTVEVPIWWYGIMQFSNGFRYAIEENMYTYGDGFRALRTMANNVGVQNPDLKRKVDEFYSECYLPALSAWRRGAADRGEALLNTAPGSDVKGPDVSWIGGKVLVDDYYPFIRVPFIVPGQPYNALYDTGYLSDPGAGAPLCSTYWADIEDDIYQEADDFGFKKQLEDAIPAVRPVTNLTTFLDDNKNEIARIYLQNIRPEFSTTSNRLVALRTGDSNWLERTGETAASIIQTYQYAKIAVTVELGIDVLVYALLIGQAYLLLVIYMCLPFSLLLGRYSFGTLMTGALLIFAVNFYSVLWTVVAFIDNWLFAQIWSNQGFFSALMNLGLEGAKQRVIHSITTASLYLTATAGLSYALMIGGSRLSFAVGQGVSSGGFSTAGGRIGGGLSGRGAVRGAWNTEQARRSNQAYNQRQSARNGRP